MTTVWISVLVMNIIIPACAVNFSRSSFLSVKSGERVTLNCPFGPIQTSVFWYKQILGEIPQQVGKRLAYNDVSIFSEFKTSGFKMEKTDRENISLIIPHIKKEDAGFYYCGKSYMDDFTLSRGTFVAVTDDGGVKVSVVQRGVWDSVPAGASVTLQCSVLSESRAAELRVFWFRAASTQSHPQIIYTHHNSSQQCESASSTHTCVYNFSKNILNLNDTGTYYCAVALCGTIVFGNGTQVQLDRFMDPLVICLVMALGVCVSVIFAQIVTCTWRHCEYFSVRSEDTLVKKAAKQGRDAVELSFAAFHLNKRQAKPERADDNVYTEVIYSSGSQI